MIDLQEDSIVLTLYVLDVYTCPMCQNTACSGIMALSQQMLIFNRGNIWVS